MGVLVDPPFAGGVVFYTDAATAESHGGDPQKDGDVGVRGRPVKVGFPAHELRSADRPLHQGCHIGALGKYRVQVAAEHDRSSASATAAQGDRVALVVDPDGIGSCLFKELRESQRPCFLLERRCWDLRRLDELRERLTVQGFDGPKCSWTSERSAI